MKLTSLLAFILLVSVQCSNSGNEFNNDSELDFEQTVDTCNFVSMNEVNPQCQHGHSDSITPIIYGFPSEEMFNKSDSGLVALGGCEISDCDPYWWCKIHEIWILS